MPSIFEAAQELLNRAPFGIITDVDGTISPIAPTPAQAKVSAPCRRYLARLYRHITLVAFISGRPVADVRKMVGIDGPVYIGNHGLERYEKGQTELTGEAGKYQALIASVTETLSRHLHIDGLIFENKGLSASIHYRLASEPEATRQVILKALGDIPEAGDLRILAGKKIIDILPPLKTDKGTATANLVRRYQLSGAIYLGDDTTDIDAFRAMHDFSGKGDFHGLAIGVTHAEMPSTLIDEADFTLNGVGGVEEFLSWLSRTAG